MEKQLFLSIGFMSVAIGIGLSDFIHSVEYKHRYTVILPVLILLTNFTLYSFFDSQRFNSIWANSNPAIAFLSQQIQNGDKVLVESGGTAILSSYPKNHPTNFTTFDWFVYNNLTGEQAYSQAVKDGYFKFIELEGVDQQDSTIFGKYHTLISGSLQANYQKVFADNGFVIYKREF